LHTTTEAKDEMEGGLFLDVVVGKGSTILKLLASEDETLLVWRNALLVLNFGFDVVDGIRRLHLKGDGLAGDWYRLEKEPNKLGEQSGALTGLDEDLHDERS